MSSVIARRDNNRNADDADLADCRGFAECDVLHMPIRTTVGIMLGKSAAVRQVCVVSVAIVTTKHITLGKSAAVRQVRVVSVPIVITTGNHGGKISAFISVPPLRTGCFRYPTTR